MLRIDCPRCGQVNSVERLERTSEEFCTNCDFPLFWVRIERGDAEQAFSGAGSLDPSLRRLPGTEGHIDVVGEACPRCAEINQPDAVFCNRCGLRLHGPPSPVPELAELPPEPLPVAAPLPAPATSPGTDYLALIAAAIALGLAILLLLGIELGIGWFALGLVVVLGTLASIAVVRRYRRRATGHASAKDHGDEGREGQVVDADFETGLTGEAW